MESFENQVPSEVKIAMKEIVYTCDVCSAQRLPSNHWSVYRETAEGIQFNNWPEVDDDRDKHICGQSCSTKVLQRWMEAQQK